MPLQLRYRRLPFNSHLTATCDSCYAGQAEIFDRLCQYHAAKATVAAPRGSSIPKASSDALTPKDHDLNFLMPIACVHNPSCVLHGLGTPLNGVLSSIRLCSDGINILRLLYYSIA